MFEVSIIIVSYNCRELMSRCLKSVYEYTDNLKYEVIVVDNNSTDDTRAMLEKDFPQVVRVYNEKNCGFACANNQGLRIAQGAHLLLLNPDTILKENSISKTLEFAQSRLKIGIVGCRLLNVDGSCQSSANGFPSWLGSLLESFFLARFIPQPYMISNHSVQRLSLERASRVDWVMGAYFLIKRELVDSIGMLDERYFMYSEEMDYCFRATKAGYEVWYFPMTSVVHVWGGMNALSRNSVAWVTISRNIFLRSHYSTWHRRSIQYITVAGLSIRVVGYVLLGIILVRKQFLTKALNFFYALQYGAGGNIDYSKVPQ